MFQSLSKAGPALDGKAIITKMIERMRSHVNVSEYEMTVQRPQWTRSFKMKVWDHRLNKKVFVRILEPAKDKDISFLRIDYNLWNYLPSVEKVMKIPPSMMLQPWMGSDFSNDDLVKESSYIDDYDHTVVGNEVVDGLKVIKIDLVPHANAPVVWGKVVYWVREKDNLPVRQQFIDEGGTLIKDLVYSDFKVLDGALLPTRWEMTPVQKQGQKTTLILNSIDFDPRPPLADSIFTEKNLRP
ncbi:MAG: outer membrane lipoprotein-sorting protein [Deltaproteobacteria bacterium]|nr:MAG: outer membrane lipoprotein-sorting protein [Deltaproteobacteria bacterium]